MRALLHLSLFAFALTAVAQAHADDDDDRRGKRRDDRHTTVVITSEPGPRAVRPVRAKVHPRPPEYGWQYERHDHYELMQARRDAHEQRRDHEQIVRIAERWDQARANRNPHALRKIEWRLDAWIEREIEESSVRRGNGRYVLRLHELRRQLRVSHRGYGYGYSHGRGYGYGRGHGYGRHGHFASRARILEELISLSEREVYRAEARVRRHAGRAYAYR